MAKAVARVAGGLVSAVGPKGGAAPGGDTVRRLVVLAVCVVGFGMGSGRSLTAQAVRSQGAAIVGRVRAADSGEPVSGAAVLVSGTALQAITAADGSFRIDPVPAGSYRLRVIAFGYQARESSLELAAGAVSNLDVDLETARFEVPDLVVTASREAARSGEVPVSVAVLSREELERRDVLSLDEALPFVQGVIFNSGQMDIRGATGLARGVGSRVLMLLDGHRQLTGVGASIDFDALPVLDVERIEIVKGPHSTLWGTNALGGVVNVITRRPPVVPQTTVRAYYGLFDTPAGVDFTGESLSMRGLNVQHSRRLGDVGATLFVGREESDGFRQNGREERWRVRAKTVFPAGSANPWELFVNWTRRDAEEFFTWVSEDRPLEVDPLELGDWIRTTDLSVGLTANPIVTPSARLQIRPQVVHTRSRNHFHDNEDFHRSTRAGTDVQLSLFPARDHAITLGGEAAVTGVTSNFLTPDPDVTDFAVFAQDEVRLSPRVRGSFGVRLDVHKASMAERDVALNPKLGLVFQSSERLSLRASVSRGYRAPSVSEQFTATTVFGFRVVPNLSLQGESAWAGELGATANIGSRVWLDAGLFWSEYTDLIEPSPAPNEILTFQFRNVARARVRGLDAGVRIGLIPEKLNLRTNYVFLDSNDTRTGEPLPYRSRHNLTTTLSGWRDHVGLDVRYRSRVDEVLAFPFDDRTSITLVDVRFAGRLMGVDVQGKIENLFQTEYVDVQERNPGPTRSFRLTVTPRF